MSKSSSGAVSIPIKAGGAKASAGRSVSINSNQKVKTPKAELKKTEAKPKTPAKNTKSKPKKSKAKPKAKTAVRKKSAPGKKVRSKKTPEKVSSKTEATRSVSKKPAVESPLKTWANKLPILKRNPLGHLLIEKLLRENGFRGGVSTDQKFLEKYSTDESIFSVTPQVVLQPKTRGDVEIATKVIASETKRFSSLSLTPRAAGTGLSGGSLTDSLVIDVCAHLHSIGEVKEKKDKITISCEPGAMWRDIEKKLKERGAYLPPYTASKDICSIGGSVSNNAAGPDSLRYGHCADWVESLDVVLCDGHTYTIKPLTWREYSVLSKEDHEHARIAREVFAIIEKNEKEIKKAEPKTKKNTAGYSIWDVAPQGLAKFKKGEGTFDLTRLISGSQGTIGIIVSITMRALPIPKNTSLIAVPIFDLKDAATVVNTALVYNPINIEIFDALSFDLALKNPNFFKTRLSGLQYYQVMLSMYTTYHIRYNRKIPEFTILVTLDNDEEESVPSATVAKQINDLGVKARVVRNPHEAEMLWQIRRASYSLSKFQDQKKRPAAFLEDMTVPPDHLSKFLVEIKKLFKEFKVTAAIHGHGGNGHFHFYPLLDFTDKTTPLMVEKMSEKFFEAAVKHKGSICGEHNDGIIRTPHLSKMFSKKALELFAQIENIFDPDDIFNPGKKVNPRFDIKDTLRTTN